MSGVYSASPKALYRQDNDNDISVLYFETSKYYILSQLSAFIWSQIVGGTPLEEISQICESKFSLSTAVIRDIPVFIQELIQAKLIVKLEKSGKLSPTKRSLSVKVSDTSQRLRLKTSKQLGEVYLVAAGSGT